MLYFVGVNMRKKGKIYEESNLLTEDWVENLERKIKKEINRDLKIENYFWLEFFFTFFKMFVLNS